MSDNILSGVLTKHDNRRRFLLVMLDLLTKRLLDFIVALLGLVILSPVFLLIALIVKVETPGPIFYRGKRAGKDGRVFGILKFRTMYERPESYHGPSVTGMGDLRVTRVGRWLRQTKLNELPQLWNVLIGEMSLVGPRPEDYDIAMGWPEAARKEVLSVRPGITSPASVMFRNEEELLSTGQVMDQYLSTILPSKLRLDQLYVRYRSFLLDLDVLLWTALVLIPLLGNYSPPENALFIGPISRLIQRYVNWFIVDLLTTFMAMAIVGTVWRRYELLNVGLFSAVGVALGFAILFSLTGALLGVNRISWGRASVIDVFDLLPAVIVATLAALLINRLVENRYDVGRPLLPEGLLLTSAGLAFVGFVIVRYRRRIFSGLIFRWFTWRGPAARAQERVLIIGGGQAAQFVAWWLQNSLSAAAFRIVGCVDDDLAKQGLRIHGMYVLGKTEAIPALVQQHDIGLVIYAIHNIQSEHRQRLLALCASTPAHVMEMPNILEALRNALRGEEPPDLPPRTTTVKHLAEIPAQRVDAWLGELQRLADAGDMEALQDRLRALRHIAIHSS